MICRATQLTGSYMKGTLVVEGLKLLTFMAEMIVHMLEIVFLLNLFGNQADLMWKECSYINVRVHNASL